MSFFKKRFLVLLFISGLILRLSLLFYDYSWDLNNHIAWAKDLHNRGFGGFYETQSSEVYASLFPNFPPLSSFIFYILYSIHSLLEKVAWEINLAVPLFPSKLVFFIQSRTFLAALMKLPAVFADLGIAWIIYLFSKKLSKNQVTNKLITSLVLFNPAFFFLSSLWGQIDSLPIFFALISIYLLLFTEKYIAGDLLFVLGILVKPTALVYLPIYLISFLQKYKLIKFIKAVLLGSLIFYLSFIPFLSNLKNPFLPFTIFTEKIMAAQSLPFVTNGAFNFWVLIKGFTGIKDTAPFLLGISYRLWGYFITGFFILLTLKSFLKTKNQFFYSVFLIAFAVFLFLTKMHERYSLLPLPFILLASLKNSPKGRSISSRKNLLKWFVVLSLISFLNLYHSWPVPKLGFITDLLYYPAITSGLSLFNVVIFFYLIFRQNKI